MAQDKIQTMFKKVFLTLGVTALFFASPSSFAMPGGDLKEEEVAQSDLGQKVFENKDLTQLIIDHLSNSELALCLNINQNTNNAAEYRRPSIWISKLLHHVDGLGKSLRNIKKLNIKVSDQSEMISDQSEMIGEVSSKPSHSEYYRNLWIQMDRFRSKSLDFEGTITDFISYIQDRAKLIMRIDRKNECKVVTPELVFVYGFLLRACGEETYLKKAQEVLEEIQDLRQSLFNHQIAIHNEFFQQKKKLYFWESSDHLLVLKTGLAPTEKAILYLGRIEVDLGPILAHLEALLEIYSTQLSKGLTHDLLGNF